MKTHWTPGTNRRLEPQPSGLRRVYWQMLCKRWLELKHFGMPDRVTCKQCRRELDKFAAK